MSKCAQMNISNDGIVNDDDCNLMLPAANFSALRIAIAQKICFF